MQLPTSDADFYERKIFRLEKDIACLNQQLNNAKARLRSAQDFQIKYELLFKQTQQQNLRIKKIEQIQRLKFNEIMVQQVDNINKQWIQKTKQMQQIIRQKCQQDRNQLLAEIDELKKKNKQMADKCEQVDALLFKNKKIVKDLQNLQEIIEQNKVNSERQRQQDAKTVRQNITKKFEQKIQKQKQKYGDIINNLLQKYEKLQYQLLKVGIQSKENQKNREVLRDKNKEIQQTICNTLKNQIQKLKDIINKKNTQIQIIKKEKIQQMQKSEAYIRQLKQYHKQLEQEIFNIQTSHQAEIQNLKGRMQQIRKHEIIQKEKQCLALQKQRIKERQEINSKFSNEKTETQQLKKAHETQIAKFKQQKQKLLLKINDLKNRLRQYETQDEVGQTQNLINSLRHGDKKQDQLANYQNGVTFLQRQLKKANIKLQKKNLQIKQLVTKANQTSSQFQKQTSELKQKFTKQINQLNKRIGQLEQEVQERNQQIRKILKLNRQKQIQFQTKLDQLNVDNRLLHNLNNNLQKDYNRILQSKKLIQKSFRQERQRSITSKSQIALAKKQKWIQLQRQKNQIQIIYKQKQEQLKTNNQIIIQQLRVQNDKLKKQTDLLQHQLKTLKQRYGKQPNKQNIQSQFHKKLATVNLEIALTQNIYSSLLKAKSRIKAHQSEQKQHKQSANDQSFNKQKIKLLPIKNQWPVPKNNQKQQPKLRQFDRIHSNQSHKNISSVQHQSQEPMYLDEDYMQTELISPTFPMQYSFHPKSN